MNGDGTEVSVLFIDVFTYLLFVVYVAYFIVAATRRMVYETGHIKKKLFRIEKLAL